MMNEWSELNKLIITPDVKQIHCDTRDFIVFIKDNLKYHKSDHLDEQKRKKGIIKTIKNKQLKTVILLKKVNYNMVN